MKTCEVCGEAVAKYRCPGCTMETCCLKCVNQHKQQSDCEGQRDKTAYVKTSEFTDLNLLSDYRFLEDGGRKTNNASRDNLKRRHNVPSFLKELEKQANKRNVKLGLMPYPMSRRKNNSTIFQHRLKKILWQIEWIFPQADYTVIDKRVNEDDTLGSILDRHIGADADPLIKHKLKCYTKAEIDRLGVFLKQDCMDTSQISYYRLDVGKSISENLQNKQIVEHPTIHVVLEDHWSLYPLVLSKPDTQPVVDEPQENASEDKTAPSIPTYSQPDTQPIVDEPQENACEDKTAASIPTYGQTTLADSISNHVEPVAMVT